MAAWQGVLLFVAGGCVVLIGGLAFSMAAMAAAADRAEEDRDERS